MLFVVKREDLENILKLRKPFFEFLLLFDINNE